MPNKERIAGKREISPGMSVKKKMNPPEKATKRPKQITTANPPGGPETPGAKAERKKKKKKVKK